MTGIRNTTTWDLHQSRVSSYQAELKRLEDEYIDENSLNLKVRQRFQKEAEQNKLLENKHSIEIYHRRLDEAEDAKTFFAVCTEIMTKKSDIFPGKSEDFLRHYLSSPLKKQQPLSSRKVLALALLDMQLETMRASIANLTKQIDKLIDTLDIEYDKRRKKLQETYSISDITATPSVALDKTTVPHTLLKTAAPPSQAPEQVYRAETKMEPNRVEHKDPPASTFKTVPSITNPNQVRFQSRTFIHAAHHVLETGDKEITGEESAPAHSYTKRFGQS